MNRFPTPHPKKAADARVMSASAHLRAYGRGLAQRHASALFIALALCALLLSFGMGKAQAVDSCSPPVCITFQTPEAFLTDVFGPTPPSPQVLNVSGAAASRIQSVYGRPFPQSRIRYWTNGTRTAWIFDDIGKEGYQPTTSAFAVDDGAIVAARVLFYRESRGEQVGEASFLQQLSGARASGGGIDKRVDNISGATYSVEMMKRMARTAIELDALAP